MNPPDNAWIRRPAPRPDAATRLFTLPWGGGGASMYRSWAALLPPDLELCLVQPPGREDRWREAPTWRLGRVVGDLVEAMTPFLDRPVVFFGHSMGALIGYATARELRRRALPGPRHLFVSARPAPHLPAPRVPCHTLPDERFLTALDRFDGIPASVLAAPDLLATLLPLLRADFAVCETYRHEPDAPLDCPISALGGRQDRSMSAADLAAWRVHTAAAFHLDLLDGGHFYLTGAAADVVDLIVRRLRRPPPADRHPRPFTPPGHAVAASTVGETR